MKKLILFLAVSFAMFSCEGDEGPMGYTGAKGDKGDKGDNGIVWHIEKFTIKSEDWQLKGQPGELNSFYYADVEIAKLTSLVFNKGTVIGYIVTDVNVKNGLPYVLHQGEEEEGEKFLWTQTYDFDFMIGTIRFYATFSDFLTQKRPGGETFNIALLW